MSWLIALEAASYIVTVLGLPLAIAVFMIQQRAQRQNEENALHRMLAEEYDNFLKLALENADLLLMQGRKRGTGLSSEQHERQLILFKILISLFEKAYIIVYDDHMTADTTRMWLSWEDDMREWCADADFRAALPGLLEGEDRAFANRLRAIAAEVSSSR